MGQYGRRTDAKASRHGATGGGELSRYRLRERGSPQRVVGCGCEVCVEGRMEWIEWMETPRKQEVHRVSDGSELTVWGRARANSGPMGKGRRGWQLGRVCRGQEAGRASGLLHMCSAFWVRRKNEGSSHNLDSCSMFSVGLSIPDTTRPRLPCVLRRPAVVSRLPKFPSMIALPG